MKSDRGYCESWNVLLSVLQADLVGVDSENKDMGPKTTAGESQIRVIAKH